MSKTEYLMQAEQAERLARSVVDPLTVDRLQEFAAECRAKAQGPESFSGRAARKQNE
jgi:hypothetical protein